MNKIVLLLLAVCYTGACLAGDGDYAVSKIPASLLSNANAVKRREEIRFEVINKEKAIHYYKVAYTILNESGDKFAACHEYYDKLRTIDYIEGTLFDANGIKIKSLKKSDIQDLSGTDESSLADDNRIKYHNFYHRNYPYTVEYEVVVKYHGTMFFPTWDPLDNYNLSVQYSGITVLMPEGMELRYKAFNIKQAPAISMVKTSKSYSWELKEAPAIQKEFAIPHWYTVAPVLRLAPVEFALEGYEGNMSSWKEFGKFIYALKAGRDILPDDIKATVHRLTDNLSDTKEKIAVLYDFLQKNTRYISIQLGIGGWQPFDAKYVAVRRYGDCKALSNYMYALLKEAGIRSYYTLVQAGEGRTFFMEDFPCSQFNHIILSVPLQKDTMWLECTSATLPAGYLSGFTSNRYVLMIGEEGGILVKTPHYSMKDNLQLRKTTAAVDLEGKLTCRITTSYKGLQEDELHMLINSNTKDKVLDRLKSEIDIPNYDVKDFNYKEERSSLPSILEELNIDADHYAQVSGRRLFISHNIMSKTHRRLTQDETRLYDIEFGYEYTDVDTAEIQVPPGFKPESMPQEVKIESKFGRYQSATKFEQDKIFYYRRMEQPGGRFPASDYADLAKFYEQIYKSDRNRVVLVKSD